MAAHPTSPRAGTSAAAGAASARGAGCLRREILKSGPLDALLVNEGESNNTITTNGFAVNISTSINGTRSAFTGVLVIDGKGGDDTISGGASGARWLIGGGVTTSGTVDTLTGVDSATDIFDLRSNAGDVWEKAYAAGNAVVKGYDPGNYIFPAKASAKYQAIF